MKDLRFPFFFKNLTVHQPKKLLSCIEKGFEGDKVQIRGINNKVLEALSALFFAVALGRNA